MIHFAKNTSWLHSNWKWRKQITNCLLFSGAPCIHLSGNDNDIKVQGSTRTKKNGRAQLYEYFVFDCNIGVFSETHKTSNFETKPYLLWCINKHFTRSILTLIVPGSSYTVGSTLKYRLNNYADDLNQTLQDQIFREAFDVSIHLYFNTKLGG